MIHCIWLCPTDGKQLNALIVPRLNYFTVLLHGPDVWHLHVVKNMQWTANDPRDHFVYKPSQWETTLQCNVVSHWLSAYTEFIIYRVGEESHDLYFETAKIANWRPRLISLWQSYSHHRSMLTVWQSMRLWFMALHLARHFIIPLHKISITPQLFKIC